MPQNAKYDLVTLGSGPAGQKAALAAAKLGKRVAIIEPRFLGGICTHAGTIPSKTFREAALHLTNYRLRFMDAGFKKKPSMEELVQRVSWVIGKEIAVLENQLKGNRIEIVPGYGKFVDDHHIEVSNHQGELVSTVETQFTVISSGTQPFLRPDVAFDGERIFYTDNALTMKKLPRSITIVGGGIIGCEYASIYSILGVKVNVIEKRPEILSLVDRDMRANLVTQLDSRKVNFFLGDDVESCAVNGEGHVEVRLSSGKLVRSEMALFCTFRKVCTDILALDKVGVEMSDRGVIKVDQDFRTSNPGIFAAGDVIGHPSLASTSFEQGRIAGTRAFGAPCQPMSKDLPIGIYTIPEISYVGPTEEELTKAKVPYQVGKAYYKDTSKGNIMGALDGVVKIMFHQESLKLLAVHVIGESASELVHVGQAVMEHGGSVEYFVENVFNFPTLAEAYKIAALSRLNRLRDV